MFSFLNSQSTDILREIAKGNDDLSNTARFILRQREIMLDMAAYIISK